MYRNLGGKKERENIQTERDLEERFWRTRSEGRVVDACLAPVASPSKNQLRRIAACPSPPFLVVSSNGESAL